MELSLGLSQMQREGDLVRVWYPDLGRPWIERRFERVQQTTGTDPCRCSMMDDLGRSQNRQAEVGSHTLQHVKVSMVARSRISFEMRNWIAKLII